MKKISTILLRLVFTVLICLSGYLLLTSPLQLNVANTRDMAKEVLHKSVDAENDPKLKASLELAQKFGLEDKVLEALPKKYQRDFSYNSLYDLGVTYKQNGELTAHDLALPENNQVQEAVSEVILHKLNHELKENAEQVDQVISVFQYFAFAMVLVFTLAALLAVFGRYFASIVTLLAAIGSFGFLQFYANQLVTVLQKQLYHGINFVNSQQLWWGLLIGIVAGLIWPICLKLTKKRA
ncbi:hypothetical protein OZX56_05820 [Lactobacillus sp. ESL0684]|uniref:hypothetical protein n=1 Tax=Lactobacillus sp. ESL0684 TaxID=2983213 RepID=UPI0023F7A35E|nr:hypothetical protein [Lactobacillus sp. ESL0684]WEV43064.1 hypothetical protein OZX56_05820 [Lactobacillus sp. ESL0684]